ncbi:hypothetical protein AWQ21_10265 [Picosynechococcus sp. PCC 7003]|uniref:sulfotransferase domain-containing protein n=1 Tax=Picosynechococcus sp. PCC 7003 TaxID=374981 RepID=UPI000810BB25|nr:sulfotransferase domain-containing protein [Picosynechococcus sp. PCC 7003]ANV84728.1 hypothetical protein AWQ21_10265 [Picosynechococcus sp. PCC 7003]
MLDKLKSTLGLYKSFNNNNDLHYEDIFFVSYPKSGTTWLQFIIANLLKKDDKEIIDFNTVLKYVYATKTRDRLLSKNPGERIIKSHDVFLSKHHKKYRKIIYLVRDARDVYVSYYHYLRKHLSSDMTFSEFLRKEDIYPSRWHTHVESWIEQPNVVLIIKYENLLKNTYEEVCKVADVFGKGRFNEEKIRKAIEDSSFENMQLLEKERGRPFLTEDAAKKSTTFVRKGIEGDWKNYFSKSDEEYLLSEASSTLKRFDYI